MNHWNKLLVASALLFTSASASAAAAGANGLIIGRYLQVEPLPGRVQDAVDAISHLGRDEGDFFTFQKVESFKLLRSSAEPRLTKILADVIQASRRYGRYSLAEYCLQGEDESGRTLAFDDDSECAAYLAGHQKSALLEETLDGLTSWYEPGSSQAVRMSKAVTKLKSFISTQVGHDYEEVSISMSGLNVTEETIVLISKNHGHIIVLKFDFGA